MIVYYKWLGMNIGGIGKQVLKKSIGLELHSLYGDENCSSAFMENYFILKKLVMIFCFVLSK